MREDRSAGESRRSIERDVTPRLVHLGDMRDLRVADGDPDIRGWDVRTADGEKIGTVKDLVVDTALMKVRYIEARIDREVLNSADDRYVLIPIGSARLDDAEDDVYLHAAVVDPRTLPPYDRTAILSREYELQLRERFPSDTPADMADFYRDARFDDVRFFGNRRRGREGASYLSALDGGARGPAHDGGASDPSR
jgi:hypothetical protein